jgi:hypothetical protein
MGVSRVRVRVEGGDKQPHGEKALGCPSCSGQLPLSPTYNFAVWCAAHDERGAQLLGEFVDPDKKVTEVTHGSHKKALWKCDTCKHT